MAWYNASWTHRAKITTDNTEVFVTESGIAHGYDLGQLDATFWANVKSDGSDIRVTTSDGSTEIPVYVGEINTGSNSGGLFFKATTNLSTDQEFYIYFGNSGASAYGVADTNGRNAVFTDWELFHVYNMVPSATTDLITDLTGNGEHGQYDVGSDFDTNLYSGVMGLSAHQKYGGIPANGATNGKIASSSFHSTLEPITYFDISQPKQHYSDGTNYRGYGFARYSSTVGTDRAFIIWFDPTYGSWWFRTYDNSGVGNTVEWIPDQTTEVFASTWVDNYKCIAWTLDGSRDLELFVDGISIGSSLSVDAINNASNSDIRFTGGVDHYYCIKAFADNAFSENKIKTYNNLFTSATFWTTAASETNGVEVVLNTAIVEVESPLPTLEVIDQVEITLDTAIVEVESPLPTVEVGIEIVLDTAIVEIISPAPTLEVVENTEVALDTAIVEVSAPLPTLEVIDQVEVTLDTAIIELTAPLPTLEIVDQVEITLDTAIVEVEGPLPTIEIQGLNQVTLDTAIVDIISPAPTIEVIENTEITLDTAIVEVSAPLPTIETIDLVEVTLDTAIVEVSAPLPTLEVIDQVEVTLDTAIVEVSAPLPTIEIQGLTQVILDTAIVEVSAPLPTLETIGNTELTLDTAIVEVEGYPPTLETDVEKSIELLFAAVQVLAPAPTIESEVYTPIIVNLPRAQVLVTAPAVSILGGVTIAKADFQVVNFNNEFILWQDQATGRWLAENNTLVLARADGIHLVWTSTWYNRAIARVDFMNNLVLTLA